MVAFHMTRSILITGATGLLGGYLLAALLREPDLELHLLLRDSADAPAGARLQRLLAYFGLEAAAGRVTIHRGDVTRQNLGLSPGTRQTLGARLTDMVHAAADTAFDDRRSAGRTTATNRGGTANLLALCRPQTRFFHVSTAFVAGLHTGVFAETDLNIGQAFRNDYERSKFAAEELVRAAFAPRPGQLTVIRPSIVVGEQASGRTFQFSSLYKVLGVLAQIAESAPRARLSFHYDPDATQNYVPVDLVTAWTRHILLHPDCWGQTWHLASENPVTNREMGELLEARLGVSFVPLPAGGAAAKDHPSRLFVRLAGSYLPYLQTHPRFRCDNRRRLPGGNTDFRIDGPFLHHLLDYCRETDWGRRLDNAR